MESLKFDILDYLGKVEDAIFVSLTVAWSGVYYDAVFCYRKDTLIITVDPKLEEIWGYPVEEWEGYSELLLDVMKKVVPYDEMIGRIDILDQTRYKIVYPN
jgi:PAS domain-containing protein